MKMRLVGFVVVLGVVAVLVYRVAFLPVTAIGYVVQRGALMAEVFGTGTLEARIDATLGSELAGRVESVLVDQGDPVEVGGLLVQLDETQLRQQVAIAVSRMETLTVALDRFEAERQRATAVLAQARSDLARAESLLASDDVSQSDYEHAREAFRIAEADLERAEAALQEGKAEIAAARVERELREAELADARIMAPFDGLVVARLRDPGDVVVPGTPLLRVISLDEIWVSAWVDETQMARVRKGQAARVVFRSQPDQDRPASVTRLGRSVDRETREFVVDVTVLELPEQWAVGQRAEVFITTDEVSGALLVPDRHVHREGGRPGVFVLQDGEARWREVQLGLHGRGSWEILDGLEEGETILASAETGSALEDGTRVELP